jgi:Ca-activated chloride channel family protein
VGPIGDVAGSVGDRLAEWRSLQIGDLLFRHWELARLALVGIFALSLVGLAARYAIGRKPGRKGIGLAAMLPDIQRSPFSIVRHVTIVLFLLGLPFFIVALADPYTSLTRQEVSYPGRRIGLVIDASSSMMEPFKAERLGVSAPSNATFFTAVAAAQSFVRQRIKGRYRDLMALIEFGDEAYVITPFTNDYDNILLSISLIDDLTEFNKFPDQGTTIGLALNQGVKLFRAFDFLNAAGNLMVVFSDGQDTKVKGPRLGGSSVDEIMAGAAAAKVPIYFIRTVYNQQMGRAFTDSIWKPAVERTGGRFYAAADENAILTAIHDIDKVAGGKIDIRQYSAERPRFASYLVIALGFWSAAALLTLTVPYFRKFP